MTRFCRIAVIWLALLIGCESTVGADDQIPTFPDDRGPDGNRLVGNGLPLDTMTYRSYRLESPIVWAGSTIAADGPVWQLRAADGQTTRLHLPVELNGYPGPAVWEKIDASSPAPLTRSGFETPGQPLPDAEPAVTRSGDVVYLSGPTSAYPHAILGDALEASRITIRPADGSVDVVIDLSPLVAEERGVLLVDLDKDGREEIVTIVSDASDGARVVAYDQDGELFATGAAIGLGYRWRHLIGAGPVGPDGEEMIVVVRTPHIGGVLEYYDAGLNVYATIPGFSSHAIGSPNLGYAVIANVDGGERWEVVLPDQRRARLSAVSLDAQGPRVVWTYDLRAPMSGNISAVSDERMSAMLVPTSDGKIHIWTSRAR